MSGKSKRPPKTDTKAASIKTRGDRPDHEVVAVQTFSGVASHYSGPVPSAGEAAAYQKLCPDAPDRFIRIVERQQDLEDRKLGLIDKQTDHSHEENMTELFRLGYVEKTHARATLVGLVGGFIIAVCGIAGGVWLASLGKDWQAIAAAIPSLGLIVGALVKGWNSEKRATGSKQDQQS